MNEIWKAISDPRVSVTLVLSLTVVVGFALIGQAYRGVAPLLFAGLQVPYVISGGIAGIAAIGAGLGILSVHLDRAEAAEERRAVADLQRDVLRLLAAVPGQR